MAHLVADDLSEGQRSLRLLGRRRLGEAVAEVLAPVAEDSPERYRFLLLARFAVVNLVGLAFLALALVEGWLDAVVAADSTRLSLVIAGLFAVGMALCGAKVWQVSRELNLVRSPAPPRDSRSARYREAVAGRDAASRSLVAAALKLKLFARITTVRHVAQSLVVLGLIGTVVGFIVALSGVKPDVAADAKAVGPMVATLIRGMSVALYTTLVGAVCNVWLMAAYRVLAAGTIKLVATLVETGERDARV